MRHITLTPDNYMSLFCEISRKFGVIVEDCQKLEHYISKLDTKYQAELKRMHIGSVDELFAFLSSRLDQQNLANLNKTLIVLVKRLLQAISMLHNKDATALANSSIQTIDSRISVENLTIMKDRWFEFIGNYDDSYLKQLSKFGVKQSDDLEKITSLVCNAKQTSNSDNLDKIAKLIVAMLPPSIATSINDEFAKISSEIMQNPSLIDSQAMQEDIKKSILKRIKLDESELNLKLSAISEILSDIANTFFLATKQKYATFEYIKEVLELVKSMPQARLNSFEARLSHMEEIYISYGIDYHICIFALNDFAILENNYGNEACNTILSTINEMLNKFSSVKIFTFQRENKIFSLFINISDGVVIDLANKLLGAVSDFKFLYKNININVNLKYSFLSRSKSKSKEELVNMVVSEE